MEKRARQCPSTDHFTLRKSLCLDNQNEIGAALRFVQIFIDEICGHAA